MSLRHLGTLTGSTSVGIEVGNKRFAIQPDVAVFVRNGPPGDAATAANGIKVAADGFFEDAANFGNTWVFAVPVSGSMNVKVFVHDT